MDREQMKVHQTYMKVCIDLAKIARQRGESPVGSIIVQNGLVIGRGIEGGKAHQDITYHAEIEAIRHATKYLGKQDLSDCVLYTTHEPCIMCSYMIRHTKIPLVVMGLRTGEIGGFSSALPLLIDTTITKWAEPPVIVKGILGKECAELVD
ncbi:nucleoside deaminase [Emticicia fontis]